MKENKCLLIQPIITDIDDSTLAFRNWTKTITYNGAMINLPDGTILDALPWLNNQNQFDNGSYTHFLFNYFRDNVK